VNRLLQLAVNVRSEARNAYRVYRSTYDIAQHYQREILPLRKIINEQTQLQYGAMQNDVFALLVEARQRIAANRAATEAKLSFWLANSQLSATISGGARPAQSDGGGETPPTARTAAAGADND
jgi:outer membrane protein TolC